LVHVALAIAGLDVSEAVELVRKRSHGLGEKRDLGRHDRELPAARPADRATGADPVAKIKLGSRGECGVAENVEPAEELKLARTVSQNDEQRLALIALGNDAAPHGDDDVRVAPGFEVRPHRDDLGELVRAIVSVAVRFPALGSGCIEFRSADPEGVVARELLIVGSALGGHAASS